MSKNSAKQNVEQLLDWLAWRKASSSFKNPKNASKRYSKAEIYKQTRERYGRRKSN